MINIAGLSKNHGNHTGPDNINLAISRGGIHGLLGTSGAGKSTILRCINGLKVYSKVSLQVNGIEISTLQRYALQQLMKIALTGLVEAVFIREPSALKRLTGSLFVHIPPEMCGIKISLDPTQMAKPVFADLALQIGLRFTMLHVHTDPCPQGTIGHFFYCCGRR